MGFSRQEYWSGREAGEGKKKKKEYWSGLPFPSPGDLPDPGSEPAPPALPGGLYNCTTWEALFLDTFSSVFRTLQNVTGENLQDRLKLKCTDRLELNNLSISSFYGISAQNYQTSTQYFPDDQRQNSLSKGENQKEMPIHSLM